MSKLNLIHKIDFRHIILILCFSIFSFVGFAQEFPAAPKALVSDYTNTLTSSQIRSLENKLRAFEDSTSIQLSIVLVETTEGYDIADYAVRLAKKWGVGQQKYNNGVMMLAALGDRAVTIQTGYGLEGVLPDVIVYRIIENEIKPAFKRADYYQGLNAATNAIIDYSKGEYKADPTDKKKRDSEGGGLGGVIVIVIIFVIIAFISKGGGNNKGGRMINGKGGSDLFWWMLLDSLGRGGSNRGGGGFGDGGGFGGFGGGDFGGGGASGRW